MKRLAGAWQGHSSLWLQPGTPAFECATSATLYAVAGGKVVAFDYAWMLEGEPQDGRLMLAVDDAEGVHMAWCDSFHMDAKIMDLAGDGNDEVIAATCSYQLPDSEPWRWRIELGSHGTDGLQLRMYNILPASMGGIEALAVQGDYIRA